MIQLSDHFTYKRLMRFVASPIFMMIVCSIYSVVDGLFVSVFAGGDAFTALNLVFPYIMVLAAVGFMFGTGGNAIVSKTMGEGKDKLAKQYFTLIVVVAGIVGVVLAAVGIVLLRPVAVWMGASGEDAYLLPLCSTYGTIILCALPFFMLQNMFQGFFSTAEKPNLGFIFTIVSGVTNAVLDALLVAVFHLGLQGAAIATALSQTVGGCLPLVYFSCKNKSRLRFCKFRFQGRVVLKACTNGFSELLGNIAMSLVSMLYNKQLMNLVGQDGVQAFGVMMYIQFIFVAVFIGYCIGSAPIIAYNYGAQNKAELQNVFKKSLVVLSVVGVTMLALSEGLADVVAKLFFSETPPQKDLTAEELEAYKQHIANLRQMTANGMRLYSICFLFAGFNMFCSGMFTALNNGIVSAVSALSRTLVFQIASIYVLPIFWGLNGIWLATVAAEFLSLVLTVVLFAVFGRRYGYVKSRKLANEQSV